MAYLIKKTSGEDLVEILDSEIDQSSTDLTLIGKNVTGYGQYINENFVKLLENFSSTSEPTNPIIGQLWYDLTEGRVKVYNGDGFYVASGPIVSSTPPLTPNQGDFWIDNNENQVFAYDGIDRILMGPIYKDSQGLSGFEVSTIKDNFGNNKTVTLLWSNANLLGVWSHHPEFTPVGLSGFQSVNNQEITIKPGFNANPVIDNFKIHATATVAENIADNNGNLKTVNDFFLVNQPNSTDKPITILNPSPLSLGASQQTSILVSNDLTRIRNNLVGQNFSISVRDGTGYTDAVKIDPVVKRIGIFNETPQAMLDVGGSVIINGDLTVNGNTVSINTSEINVDDKTITLANTDIPTDTNADGGGLILKGSTDHTLLWSNTTDAWNSNEHFNISSGKAYRINNVDILTQTALSSSVTSALGLTQIGTLTSLQVDNININGSTIGSSSILNLNGSLINVNNLRISNVESPALLKDAANKEYVDNKLETGWVEISVDTNVLDKSKNLVSTISGPVAIGLPENPLPGFFVRFADYDGTFNSNNLIVARYRTHVISAPNGVAAATGIFNAVSGLGLSTTGGTGTGLTVSVEVNAIGTYTGGPAGTTIITPIKQGYGYQNGDTIVVSGTLLGGTSPANDLIFELNSLDNILGINNDLVVTTKNAAFGLVYTSPSQGWSYLETLQFPPTVIADLVGDVTGNVVGDVTGNVVGDVTGDLTGTVLTSDQPNITSVGTLDSLAVTGTITAASFSGDLTGDVTGTLFGSVTGSSLSSPTALTIMSSLGDIKLRSGANGIRLSVYDDTGVQEQYSMQMTPGTAPGNRNSTLLFGDIVVENISTTNITGSSFRLPQYSTAQRDARTYTALNYGELLYNTDTNKVQTYTSTGWVDLH